MPSARWRTRKARGIIQSESKDVRNREVNDVNLNPSTKA